MHRGFFTEKAPRKSHLAGDLVWHAKFASALTPLAAGLCFCLASGAIAAAQQSPKITALPQAPSAKPAQDTQQKPPQGTLGTTIGLVSRRSVFFPELAHQPGALTTREKAELAADISIAPSRFLSSVISSAIDQAHNAIPGYGQGWDAYGKRLGSSLATTASANVFGTFALASAFRQDPRYFVKANGTFKQKIGNAFERVVVTRTDYGSAPNWSGLLGDLLAESLANSYLPQDERTAGKTFRRFGIRIGISAGVNIFKEYWPSIFKNLRLTKLEPNPST